MHKRNTSKDPELDRIIQKVANELGVSDTSVWAVYNHFYLFIFKLMTRIPLATLNPETRRIEATNINIPGFGRFCNKYGKKYRNYGSETPKEDENS